MADVAYGLSDSKGFAAVGRVEQIYQFLYSLKLELTVGDPAAPLGMSDYLKPVGYLGLRQKRVRPASLEQLGALEAWESDDIS